MALPFSSLKGNGGSAGFNSKPVPVVTSSPPMKTDREVSRFLRITVGVESESSSFASNVAEAATATWDPLTAIGSDFTTLRTTPHNEKRPANRALSGGYTGFES